MEKLTAKQEAFAQALADGLSQSAAYRRAYDAKRMKDETVTNKASLLAKRDDIGARVDQLRDKLADEAIWSRRDSVEGLKGIADNRTNTGAERVSAIKALNEMHGFNKPQKVEVDHRNLKPIEDEDWL